MPGQDGAEEPPEYPATGDLQAIAGEKTDIAAAGADVAQDHECSGAAVPAIADVRARRAFAHGMQFQRLDQLF